MQNDHVEMIDQRILPNEYKTVSCNKIRELNEVQVIQLKRFMTVLKVSRIMIKYI